MLDVGTMVPDLVLPDQTGAPVCLFDELERGPIVLTFYVKDATFG